LGADKYLKKGALETDLAKAFSQAAIMQKRNQPKHQPILKHQI